MSPLSLLRGILLYGLSLTSTTSAIAQPAEAIPIPGVDRLGTHERFGIPSGFISNDGRAVLLAKDDASRLHLLVWTKSSLRRVELPGAIDGMMPSIAPLPDDRVVLSSFSDDGSMHFGPAFKQLYSLTKSGTAKLRWTASEADYDLSPIQVSGDGKAWGVMAPSIASKEAREALGVSRSSGVTSGLHFAFGNFRSPKVRRTHAVMFHDWYDHRTFWQGDDSRFTFLDSDGPVLVAPYADDVHLLRFTDSGVISEQIEPMKPLMKAVEERIFFRWQDEDRVLWTGGADEWLAWNLWDLGLSGFPEEPFLRFPSAAGRPHRTRGFVRTVRDGNRYRVEHLWQSPQIPSWKERHVSEWQQSSEWQQGTYRRLPDVSPNGRHVLALEQRLPEEEPSVPPALEDEQTSQRPPRYHARRFELSPAPVEFPEPIR